MGFREWVFVIAILTLIVGAYYFFDVGLTFYTISETDFLEETWVERFVKWAFGIRD